MHPNQIIDWKKLLLAQAPGVFGAGAVAAKERAPADLGPLHAKIGQQALEIDFENFGKPEIINTDQGSQFTAQEFVDAVLDHGVKLSMDEPIIGHLKADHRMDRCHLKGQTGDAIHAVLCAAGYNIKWLLRMIRKKGIRLFLSLLEALGLGQRTKANGQSNRINPFSGFKTYTQRAFA